MVAAPSELASSCDPKFPQGHGNFGHHVRVTHVKIGNQNSHRILIPLFQESGIPESVGNGDYPILQPDEADR